MIDQPLKPQKRTPLSVIRKAIDMRRKRHQKTGSTPLLTDLHWYLWVVPRTLFIVFLSRPFTIKGLCLLAKCRERCVHLLWRLERRFLPRLTRPSLDQSLVRAVYRKEEHNVAIFLQRGAKPNLYLSRTRPMLPSIVTCRSVTIVRLLLEAGANVDARDRATGETSLMQTVKRNDVEMVTLLLHHGAQPDARSSLGIAPIVYASWNGYTEVVRLLIEHGADPFRSTPGGYSAEDGARDNNHAEILAMCTACQERTVASKQSNSSESRSFLSLGVWTGMLLLSFFWGFERFSRDSGQWGCLFLCGIVGNLIWLNLVEITGEWKRRCAIAPHRKKRSVKVPPPNLEE